MRRPTGHWAAADNLPQSSGVTRALRQQPHRPGTRVGPLTEAVTGCQRPSDRSQGTGGGGAEAGTPPGPGFSLPSYLKFSIIKKLKEEKIIRATTSTVITADDDWNLPQNKSERVVGDGVDQTGLCTRLAELAGSFSYAVCLSLPAKCPPGEALPQGQEGRKTRGGGKPVKHVLRDRPQRNPGRAGCGCPPQPRPHPRLTDTPGEGQGPGAPLRPPLQRGHPSDSGLTPGCAAPCCSTHTAGVCADHPLVAALKKAQPMATPRHPTSCVRRDLHATKNTPPSKSSMKLQHVAKPPALGKRFREGRTNNRASRDPSVSTYRPRNVGKL